MSEFYNDLAAMVTELLQPAELGQGPITIARITPGTPDPDAPWVPVEPTTETVTVFGNGLVKGQFTSSGTLIETDHYYFTAWPSGLVPRAGDVVTDSDGNKSTILRSDPFPSHGTKVYLEIFSNR